MLYLLMAIIAVIVSFSVAGAWFLDRDEVPSNLQMGGAVIVKLVGSGEDGAIQNFKELYDSDGGAYPGDKILDSIKVQMGENTEESVLRVKYSVNILDEEKNVKTEDLTEAETNLVAMLENDLKSKTTLYSSDWAQTSSDWVYYKHLASGKTKPIDLFDEYSLPLPDSQMNNSYQELSFRISLVAEAIQAANILSHEEWNNDITNLSDSALIERIIKYNGERFADVDEVLPYIESTGGQYIDTGYVANVDTAVEATFQTNVTNKWLLGSRTSGGASNSYAVHVSSMSSIWFQMANDSSNTQFSISNISNKQTKITVNKDAAYLNGTQIGTVGRTSFGENTLSLYIGAINANGSATDRPFVGEIYSSKIWDNGKLVRFFVPARDKDGNVGLYDLVTNQMYLNAGTGSFRYGHSINYVTNGGTISENSPKTFVSSDLPITLPTPTREGYEFGGWFLSSDFSGAAQTTIPAGTDNNVYVYAKWIKTYNITYHLGGGENAESNPQTFSEKILPLTLAAPTREGFTFAGWYQNPAYSGNQVTKIDVGTEKNVSLWAKWDAIEYSVSYVLNGGVNNNENVTKYTILDTPVKIYNPIYEGYVFEGWFSSSDFSGGRVTYLSKNNLANVTLYAKWSLAYTITYNTNGGLNDGRNPSVFTENTETFTLFDATRVNYTFLGWFDNEELSGTAITEIAKGTKNNITLWAKWSSTQITVTFDPNGGGVSPVTKVVKKGETYEGLPTPTKAGYVFDGWFTELDGGTKVLNGSTIISNADHTLYAHWTENVYTVTYNLDGGTNNANNPATFKCSDLPIALLDATKVGEYFAGWYMDASFTKRVTNIDAGSLKNIELWARFSLSPLVFDPVGSSAYSVRAANSSISGEIEIPATYNDKPVVVIQNSGFKNCSNMTAISIPNSIRSIGINAFENCSNIAEVVIPEGVTLVGNNTFLGCVKLANVTLPTSLESIGSNAFAGCSSLTMIALPKNVEEIGTNAFGETSKYGEEIPMTSDFWTATHYQNKTSSTFETGAEYSTYAKIVGYQQNESADTAWRLEMKNTMSVVGGKTYTISFYVKATNWVSAPYFIVRTGGWDPVVIWSTGTQALPKQFNFESDGKWHRIEFSVTAPTEATTMKVRIGMDSPNIYGVGSQLEIAHFIISKPQTLTTVEVYGDTPATLKTGVFPDSVSKIYVKPSLVSTYKTAWAEYKDKIVGFSQYTITYNLNGGTNNAKNITTFSKVDLPILIFEPTKENADFLGWYATPDFSGEKVTEITTASNVTLYARWDRKMSITYVLNGGSNNAANLTTITESMLPYTLSFAIRTNHAFLGWFTDETLQNQITEIATFGDITVYAAWEAIDPNLIFTLLSDKTGYSVRSSGTGLSGQVKIPSVHLGLPVTTIEIKAFQNCTGLTQIYIPASVTTISANSSSNLLFEGCNSSAVICCEAESKPSGWVGYWNYYNGYSSLSVVWGVKGFLQKNSDWSYAEKNDGTILLVKYLGNSTNVSAPSLIDGKSVTGINLECFKDNATITQISIENGVKSIGRNAFENCTALTQIFIPSSVTTISDLNDYSSSYSTYSPFYGCGSSAVIFCEASSEPSGWGRYWNYYNSSSRLKTIWNVAGFPQQNTEWEYFEKTDGTMALVKYLGTATAVTVPSTLSGKTVNEIYDNCFKDNASITSVTIPSSVTSIGINAFYNCTALTSIDILNGVTSIGENAFENCTSMRKIYIPISVTTISASSSSYSPFYGWNSSAVIYCGASSEPSGWGTGWRCYESSGSTSSLLPTVWGVAGCPQQNEDWEFVEKTDGTIRVEKYIGSATDVTVPSTLSGKTVSEIYASCFENKTAITSVAIPSSVTSIGISAFSGCSKLTSINIPNGVTSIGSSAFAGCNALATLTIPFVGESLTSNNFLGYIFGASSYSSNSSKVPSSLKTVVVTNGSSIPGSAFYDCSKLTSITIPSSVTSIGNKAFQHCTSMTKIYIPSSVTTISASSSSYSPFYGWNSSAVIYCGAASKPSDWGSYWNYYNSSSQLKVVWNVAGFEQNSEWEYLEKNDGTIGVLKYLGSEVEVAVPSTLSGKTVSEIYASCFENKTAITSVAIPSSVTSIGSSAFSGCSGLTRVNISDLAAWFKISFSNSTSNPLYYAQHLYLNNTELTELTIPSSITQINACALCGASSITAATIPSSVTSIGSGAFYGCTGLTSITIPSSVTSIGSSAFSGCSGLTSITLPDGLTSIGVNAFGYCTGLTKIYIPASVTTITTSNNTSSPFYGCKSSLKIYCGASSKPSGWGQYWNYYKSSGSGGNLLSVTWGASGLPES